MRRDALAAVAGSPGIYRATFDVPAGTYDYKVALNNSWDENYGAGGAPGGANIPITAPGGPVTFTYDHHTHVISDDAPRPLQAVRGAHWLRAGMIAWRPPAGAQTYRLHSAPDGGLAVEGGAITGGSSVPLELDAAGLPADVRAQFPHLASWPALRLSSAAQALAPELLEGRARGRRLRRRGRAAGEHRRAGPGRARRPLRGRRARGARPGVERPQAGPPPSLAVWAPTAKDVTLLLDPAGAAPERRVAMRRGDDGVWRAQRRPVVARRGLPLRGPRLRADTRRGGRRTSSPTRTPSR